jgi:pyridoxamine 5'-phosphate oxidase
MDKTIAEIRREYRLQTLLEENAPAEPFQLFRDWWKAALESKIEEPNAMTLATATAVGLP